MLGGNIMSRKSYKNRNSSKENKEAGTTPENNVNNGLINKGSGKNDCSNRSNSSRKSNGKRSNRRNKGDYDSTDNDASWYMRYPELARDASKMPFTVPLGKYPAVTSNAPNNLVKLSKEAFSVPGIMAIEWIPTIGQSDSNNSPVNLVSREVYSFVRHANSGHSNYDAPDMMMYILAMDSLYSFYSAMTRVYGVMMLYSGMNRYMPKALVESMGFNFEDISQNMAQFRWLINQVAYKLTALYVPAGMSYFERHIWLNSGVYLDAQNYKAQTYVFKQGAYYKYSASAATGYAAKLLYTEVPSKLTVTKCQDFVNSLLNPILADEDMNVISGDMLRAFGADNLFTVAPISEDYVVVPSYSPEVLSQIQNLTIMGKPDNKNTTVPGDGANIIQRVKTDTFTPGIYQVLSFIGKYGPRDTVAKDELYAWNCVTFDKMVTMHSDNPSSEEVMVATRLSNISDIFGVADYQEGATNYSKADIGCSQLSTEVVINLVIYITTETGSLTSLSVAPFMIIGQDIRKTPGNAISDMEMLSALSAFDWHPQIYLMHSTDNTGTVYVDGSIIETNNFTVIDNNDLMRLHETALISEFYIPDVRKLSSKPVK